MKYRLGRTDDIPQIEELCKKQNLPTPTLQLCFVADDEGKIVGFISLSIEAVIDCLISENPVSAVRLMDMMMGACTGHKRVICQTKRENVVESAKRYGFHDLGS